MPSSSSMPSCWSAARTRTRLSRTLASARPTIWKNDGPRPESTSTRMGCASSPSRENVSAVTCIARALSRKACQAERGRTQGEFAAGRGGGHGGGGGGRHEDRRNRDESPAGARRASVAAATGRRSCPVVPARVAPGANRTSLRAALAISSRVAKWSFHIVGPSRGALRPRISCDIAARQPRFIRVEQPMDRATPSPASRCGTRRRVRSSRC